MFSGLVETQTKVIALLEESDGVRLRLARPESFDDVGLGDSIATNGCCLTVVDFDEHSMDFQAGEETLSKTTLGQLAQGSHVNCERSLALGDRLGGHLVTGHVDGQGRLVSKIESGDWCNMVFSADLRLLRQMANKGSIAVDGVSLTLVEVTDETFSVALIPHTLQATTLGALSEGDAVNLETDLLAKYVERQLAGSKTND